ncbi:MAG TPA: PH domain-containing protein [Steroidobacteraceae bacterium]|nr:PH domain-containing protein [Steroidobacteraceae bacterium]
METSHVDRGTISVWRWQGLLATLIPAVWSFGLVARFGAPGLIAPLLIAAVGSTLIWVWPEAYFRRLRFFVDASGIAIERGVFWRSRIAVPRARIQHTDVSQGPLQRRYGVGTLKLYTAGSRYTKIELPGLAHADALELRDALLAKSGDSGV